MSPDLASFKRWISRTDERIRKLETGATMTRPAPRFLPIGGAVTVESYATTFWTTLNAGVSGGAVQGKVLLVGSTPTLVWLEIVATLAPTAGLSPGLSLGVLPTITTLGAIGASVDLTLLFWSTGADVRASPVPVSQPVTAAATSQGGQVNLFCNQDVKLMPTGTQVQCSAIAFV